MIHRRISLRIRPAPFAAVVVALFVGASTAAAQGDAAPGGATSGRSLLSFVQAGGPIGYTIIVLSVAGLMLTVDSFLRLKSEKLLPPGLVQQSLDLAQRGRFSELRSMCKGNDSMFGRIVGAALDEGNWGVDAVREALQRHGTQEVTHLHQRVGYIGLIGAVAPMLGLLGAVTGMIGSFQVLGAAKGAARPDELAVGISEALVTTTMGLIVALPMMFFYSFLRDRVTRIGQRAGGLCEQIVRIMSVVVTARGQQQAAEQHP